MIAADAPPKSQETVPAPKDAAEPVEFYFSELVRLLARQPRYRWQVWLHFQKKHGLGAALVVQMITRAKFGGWIFESNGKLYSAMQPAVVQA